MTEIVERLEGVEKRLISVGGSTPSASRWENLRVLHEASDDRIKGLAEIVAHHGKRLDEIADAVKPIAQIRLFIESVAHDHELRITTLEKHVGIQ